MNLKINKDTKITSIKLMKIIISMTIVIMLSIGAILPVLASPDLSSKELPKGTEEFPARAAITKMLQMPVGVTVPQATFEFEFEPLVYETIYEEDGETVDKELSSPDIPPVLAKYTSGSPACKTENDIKYIHSENEIDFSEVTWPHAGIYPYFITEKYGTYDPDTGEEIYYSTAKYRMEVYVVNGAAPGDLYIEAIGVFIEIPDDTYDAEDVGKKVDPTPGGDPKLSHDHSKLIFTNYYLKYNGGENPEDTVLKIGKTVEGGYGDKTLPFEFTITITHNPMIVNMNAKDPDGTIYEYKDKIYKAYMFDVNGLIISDLTGKVVDSQYVVSDGTNDYIEFESGKAIKVLLIHGDYLSFIDMPIGTTYDAGEEGTPEYTPTYLLKASSEVVSKGAAKGSPLSLEAPVKLTDLVPNDLKFINTFQTITPTGIGVDDLPYFVIIGLTAVALGAFMVLVFRRYARKATDK